MTPPDDVRGRTSPERWARVRAAVEGALATPAAERAAYLDAACGSDMGLREEITRLVAACESAGESDTFFGEPAAGFAAPVLAAVDARRGGASDTTVAMLNAGLLASYVVEREIGAGGMATVYLAHDRKHQRRVAIKVLRPELAAVLGAERFLDEIRVTAALQHPNLLPLFDSGDANGLLYYVMPFVEGQTLRARLEVEQQLPVDEAVRLATAVAGALDYAHRNGVIHRDLKPENILLHEGEPVVADFGIALAISKAGGQRVTQTGMSLGTPRYMSPEQASADRVIDARSDVYSLACLLYETLTGETPHTGPNVQSVIARVLTEAPRRVRATRPAVPEHVDAAIDRALSKLPADRFASAREFADALGARATTIASVRASGGNRIWKRVRTRAAFVAMLVGVSAGAWLLAQNRAAPTPKTARFVISSLTDSPREGAPTITPDGQYIVFVGSTAMKHAILVRRIDELSARPLAGTEGAMSAFVSPDGRRIGFLTTDDKLKAVPIAGGPAATLASVFRYSFAYWSRDGDIVLDSYGANGLARLADTGGVFTPLTRVDAAHGESRHAAPILTPDGANVLFTVVRQRSGPGTLIGEIAIAPYDARATQPAAHHGTGVNGRQAVAIVDQWLLYVASDGASIQAVRFDKTSGRASGAPVAVLQDTSGAIEGVSLVSNGTLLYTRRRASSVPVLADLNGAVKPLLKTVTGTFMNPRLSPDGTRIVAQGTTPQGNDLWLYDVASHTPTRLTTTGSAQLPAWTPDGRRIVFWSQMGAAFWWMRADGDSLPEMLLSIPGGLASSVTSDGRNLVFERLIDGTWSIWDAPMNGAHTPRPLVKSKSDSYMPAVSPDNNWLAFASNVSGRYEVYVQPFPGPGAPVQVSDSGGGEPVWSPDGRRLFYRGDGRLIETLLTFAPRVAVSARKSLFSDTFDGYMPHANYDVLRDGKHFVMVGTNSGPETVVTLDWLPELRARLAAAR
ncbi:MAG: protein kinase [bacterium]